MGTGYTRNDTTNNIADGNVINAADLDGEFDAIETALGTGGHTHDGTAAEGGPVTVLGPAQDFVVSASIVSPKTDNTLDLGTSTLEFKDLYLDGTAHIDTLDVDENAVIIGNLDVGGNLTVTGTTTFNGGTITLGDAATDNVVFAADVDSSIIPDDDDTYDLGSATQEWRDLFLDGTAHIDTLDVDVNATVAGTLGVTGIATFTDDIIIGDGKTIGSASDVDAITIAANGQLTLTQTLIGTALDISGDVDIDGTTNLDVVDIDGAVDMATTLAVAGNVDFNGDLDVDGTTNLDVVDIDGAVDMASTLAVTGIATFTDDIIIGDGKTIGSASDVDAIAIGADGDVTLTQDLELQHDGATISFGASDEITVTHVADRGLTITNTNTGDDKPIVLQLKSEEDIMQANELIASIEFAAGDSDGTDGATIAAGIHAIAEDDFSDTVNTTKLVFTTGASETAAFGATAKMTLSSAGLLTIADDFMIKDGGTIGVASTAGAITIASDGDTTFNADVNVGANFDVTGNAVIDGTALVTGVLTTTAATVFNGGFASNANSTVGGTLGVTGVVTANAGVVVDNFTLDGTTLALSSGNMTLDSAGETNIDSATSGIVRLKQSGTNYGTFFHDSNNFYIKSNISDGDLIFQGNDGGTGITALTLDMSNAGRAFFNVGASFSGDVAMGDSNKTKYGAGEDLIVYSDGTNGEIEAPNGDLTLDVAGDIILDAAGTEVQLAKAGTLFGQFTTNATPLGFYIDAVIQDGDLFFRGNDGGATITALTLDMSNAGNATFNSNVLVPDNRAFVMGAASDFQLYHEPDANIIQAVTSDQDIVFKGNDGGSAITALTLDMSDAGTAAFNHDIKLSDGSIAKFGTGGDLEVYHNGTHAFFDNSTGDTNLQGDGDVYLDAGADVYIDFTSELNLYKAGVQRGVFTAGDAFVTFGSSNNNGDVRIMGIDGGAGMTALTFDMSDGGTATFNNQVKVANNSVTIGATADQGFDLNVTGITKFQNAGNDTFGQLLCTASGSGNDAQISMTTDGNGRSMYVDDSDSNTMRFSGGNGKNHSSDMKISNAGNVVIGGSLSKGSGSFKIRHPLEAKKNTHYLVHSFIEGPQADNIYRGKVDLVSGSATQNIDTVAGMSEGTFAALNREVQCFTTNESGWTAIKGSVSGNILTITAQEDTCTDTISWMVIGERKDPHMMSEHTDWTDSDGKIIIEPELTDRQKSENTEYDPICGC